MRRIVALLLLTSAAAFAQVPAETAEQRAERMQWWREARFGMFIHWGIYSVPAGTYHGERVGGIGEWIMNNARIPVDEYADYAKEFSPVKFDADEWVALAKAAGMKYLVITSKHHDGFAMFHSQASPYNIHDATPFQRDPLKELSEACQRAGIKLGFYYSQAQDWHHPGGGNYSGNWDEKQNGSMDDYLRDVAIPQVREILTNYGPISVLWWDTPANMTPERAAPLFELTKLQPGIITNNRLGGGFPGDLETPEQEIPATGFGADRAWETCMTMNDTWGFKSYDDNWKPVEMLIRNLVDIASKGGNYLLNVGPTSEGVIPQPSVERLQAVGKWMAANGEAIYGTSASPFPKLSWGRCTRKPGLLYLHVFDWPRDGKLLVPLGSPVKSAHLLSDRGRALACATGDYGLEISLPAAAPDPIASVVVLEIEGEPTVLAASLRQEADGTLRLLAADAEIKGTTAKLETKDGQSNIGFWSDVDDTARWEAKVTKPGTFEVDVTYSCEDTAAGGVWAVAVGDQVLGGTSDATNGWGDFRTVTLGRVTVAEGPVDVLVRGIRMPQYALLNLRSVVLRPVAE